MCTEPGRPYDARKEENYDNQLQAKQTESHMVYELKQQREYLLRKLLDIQTAIDAVNRTTF